MTRLGGPARTLGNHAWNTVSGRTHNPCPPSRRRCPIAGAASVIGFLHFGMPWIALKVAERIPPSVECNASDQVVKVLERFHLDDSRLPQARQQALRAAFRGLNAHEPRAADMRLIFAAAPGLGANAFALPDGRIYMTDELVALAKSDDELLAVLAREAGHHVHRHGLRGAMEGSAVFQLSGLMLGDAAGSSLAVSRPPRAATDSRATMNAKPTATPLPCSGATANRPKPSPA